MEKFVSLNAEQVVDELKMKAEATILIATMGEVIEDHLYAKNPNIHEDEIQEFIEIKEEPIEMPECPTLEVEKISVVCAACNTEFDEKQPYLHHINFECEKSPDHKCPQCDYSAKRLFLLDIHIHSTHITISEQSNSEGRKIYICQGCRSTFLCKSSFLSHVRNGCAKRGYGCPYCNFRGRHVFHVYNHVRRSHKPKPCFYVK